jgi:glycosyltransferase involved in cell wall biosynthesis
MDLCAEMLLHELRTGHADRVEAVLVGPPFCRRATRLPGLKRRKGAVNLDRLLNRFWDYPRHLRRRVAEFDLFHLCDHSYSQLVHVLPAERVGVLCHDLDTFRCLLEPQSEPRPAWFRAMARHILRGLGRAAVVFYLTSAIRAQMERFDLVDPARLVQVPNGVCPEFTPPNDGTPLPWPEWAGRPYVLHVGRCIPRKRIDLLLEVFAAVHARRADVFLAQIGGEWTVPQRDQLRRLKLENVVVQKRGLGRRQLAQCYRQAALVLLPSETEGFGLPVIEALACGAPVLVSDIPVFREVGGNAVRYAPVGDVTAWTETVLQGLDHPDAASLQASRLAWAGRYTWAAQAKTIIDTYHRLGLV